MICVKELSEGHQVIYEFEGRGFYGVITGFDQENSRVIVDIDDNSWCYRDDITQVMFKKNRVCKVCQLQCIKDPDKCPSIIRY